MKYDRQLILSGNKGAWKQSSTHCTSADKKNLKVLESVWERDKNTCFYCGFFSAKYQEVSHLNENHNDFSLDNLVTACPLCHQSFHLDTAYTAKIIWLPEMCQQDLNYLCRTLFIAMEKIEEIERDGGQEEGLEFIRMSRAIYQTLEERSSVVDQYFHGGASSPAQIANAFIRMGEEKYNEREKFLKNFKMLHSPARFTLQVKYWSKYLYNDVPIQSWENIIKDGFEFQG